MDTLGARLKYLRKENGLTQIQLADRIYVSESYIALIEADKRNPSIEIVSKLADVFHVTTDYIVNGSPKEEDKLMLKEWTNVLKDRPQQEIDSALKMVKAFFECIDNNRK